MTTDSCQRLQDLEEWRVVAEGCLRLRCERGEASLGEQRVLAEIDKAYTWVNAEMIMGLAHARTD